MKERGSALLTAVVAVVVLSLIAGTFFSLSASRARMETSEEKGLKAYYLAEAGIQFGVAHAYHLMEIPEEPVSRDNPFGEDYGGSFTVYYFHNEEEESVLLRSTGKYRGVVRKIEAKFSLAEE
ncbi:MAG: hypothetical protein ACOX3R_04200 [Desulfitobacteriia bacterium]|jgi:chitin-binding protein